MKRQTHSTQGTTGSAWKWQMWLASGWAGKAAVVVVAVAVVLAIALLVSPALASTFSDVSSDTYENPDYPNAVNTLSDLGVITGFSDGTFRPHDPVTRQQFAKMMVKLAGIKVTGDEVCLFVDVLSGTSASDPFYPDKYVAVCASCGIAKGIDATHFAPYNNITRAQVISMVVRAAAQAGVTLQEPGESYYSGKITNSNYRNLVDANHGHNVQIAEVNNLLWGIWPDNGNTWDIYGKASRGEVAQILWRLWQKMGSPQTTTSTTNGATTTTTQKPPTTTSTTQPPTTTTTTESAGTLVLSDDFSKDTGNWPVGADTDFSKVTASVENGQYVLTCQPPFAGYVYYYPLDVSNGRVAADLTLLAGGDNANCGLLFRFSDKGLYRFSIRGNGDCALFRGDASGWTNLTKNWTSNFAVHRIGQTNKVEADMSGKHLTVSVNGAVVADITDDDAVMAGTVGFWVEPDTDVVRAVFDNVKVWMRM